MEYDPAKIDEAVLALLGAFSWNENGSTRAWKNFNFEVCDRLFDMGLIHDPKRAAKSLVLTEKGVAAAQTAAAKLFKRGSSPS